MWGVSGALNLQSATAGQKAFLEDSEQKVMQNKE